jgi:hypothetical protein
VRGFGRGLGASAGLPDKAMLTVIALNEGCSGEEVVRDFSLCDHRKVGCGMLDTTIELMRLERARTWMSNKAKSKKLNRGPMMFGEALMLRRRIAATTDTESAMAAQRVAHPPRSARQEARERDEVPAEMTGQTLPLQGDGRPGSGRSRKGVSGTVTEIGISESPKPCDRCR